MVALLATWLILPCLANSPVDGLAVEVANLNRQVDMIQAQVAGERGFLDATETEERFEEALMAHMVGEHLEAAERFFLLTQVLTDTALRRDAQWYLAESLTAIGSHQLAEETLREIDVDPNHPFREAASLQLLDLYASTHREADFLSYYASASARITPGDSLTYALGKCFFTLEHSDRAHALLEDLSPSSEYYARARYLLGTLHIREGDLDEAVTHYKDILSVSLDTTTDRQVHDLALLAMARIAFERGEYADASRHYASLSGDTDYLDEQLYEQVWTYVRLEEDGSAMNALELFLLHFPDHPNAGRLRLARGHLQMRQRDWESATQEYEDVIAEYEPLRGAEFDALPTWMRERIEALPEVASAHRVVQDLDEQAALLEASAQIADELHTLLEGTPVLRRHEQLTVDTAVTLDRALQTSLALLELHTLSLSPQGRDQRSRVAALRDAQGRLLRDVLKVEANPDLSLHEARAATESFQHLRGRLDAQWTSARKSLSASPGRKTRVDDRITPLAQSVDTLLTALDQAYQSIHQQSQTVKGPLQKHVIEQERLLQSAMRDHDRLAQVGTMVLHTAERQGTASMEGFLAGAIRQADMGLADAAWNELIDVVERRESAQREKNEKLLFLESTMEELRRRSR
jgi:tetratricopeptide (TPR) repeat protein